MAVPDIIPPSPKQVARRPSRSFSLTEVVVLNLGVAGTFALLLVAVGIAFRVAEEPGVFAQPLSVTTNKMSVLVEARFREEIDRRLSPYYDGVEELTDKDVLYRWKEQ